MKELASEERGGPSGTSAGGGALGCRADPAPPPRRPASSSLGSAPAGKAAGSLTPVPGLAHSLGHDEGQCAAPFLQLGVLFYGI